MAKHFIDELLIDKYSDSFVKELLDSPIIKYLKKKTASYKKGSKTRGAFANIYAIYVLVEDYINKGFLQEENDYSTYEGCDFIPLFERQRELPFGEKLQNHALNHRCNQEFEKDFPNAGYPIIRDTSKGKYWINENLITVNGVNIAEDIINIVNTYIDYKRENFMSFFDDCVHYSNTYQDNKEDAINFISRQLNPNVDARIFEIVSYCLIKYYFINETVYFGYTKNKINEVPIKIFKTGRTNANDGGIDFIMKPEGRIFQVTEDLNFKKFFLDIDKLNHYPITFIIKIDMSPDKTFQKIKENAHLTIGDDFSLNKYLNCFEEVITIPTLKNYLQKIFEEENVELFFKELILQCKIEFNIKD